MMVRPAVFVGKGGRVWLMRLCSTSALFRTWSQPIETKVFAINAPQSGLSRASRHKWFCSRAFRRWPFAKGQKSNSEPQKKSTTANVTGPRKREEVRLGGRTRRTKDGTDDAATRAD